MVAYSFKSMFVPQIEALQKRQTIRARGKRHHAQRGETLQLYKNARQANMAKIIPDHKCLTACRISFIVPDRPIRPDNHIHTLMIDDRPRFDLDQFAEADGFGLDDLAPFVLGEGERYKRWIRPIHPMTMFFIDEHGPGVYGDMVLIKW
ncbi:MAG: hypothetical protein GY952_13970 [Rhodobacteraceae bacterium]|nr:hypothetical protein [Paracoccaceae bacterium]